MKQIKCIGASLLLFLCLSLSADQIGSDSAVSTQPFFLFPVAPIVPNRIANFAWMQGGFGMQNSLTSLLFDSVFPVSGNIQLNGGTLTLNRDLVFDNVITLQGLGTVIGDGHIFSLSPGINSLPSTAGLFQDTTLVLNSDLIIKSAITFQGNCAVQGNGHTITLNNSGSLSIDGTLLLQNVILEGVQNNNVQCIDPSSSLLLETVTWIQTDDFDFNQGSLACTNLVTFKGTSTFSYTTGQISTINANTIVMFDTGFTFRYDPVIASQSLIEFIDATSLLILNSATLHASSIGMLLTNGAMIAQGDSKISSEFEINIGDGIGVDDFVVTVAGGAQLQLAQGLLNYENSNEASWIMENSVSQLDMSSNTTLALYETLNLGSGVALFENNSTLARVPAATLDGSITALGVVFFVII